MEIPKAKRYSPPPTVIAYSVALSDFLSLINFVLSANMSYAETLY